jgi:hypothetical protein
MHTMYTSTNKCFREGTNSEGCLREPQNGGPEWVMKKIGGDF